MRPDRRGLLRWYPRRWRARYEDEMLVLLDDQLGDGRAPLRLRVSLVGHGLAERARGFRRLADVQSREARWRNGSVLVLVAWAGFMVGGVGFSKVTEHFDQAVHPGSRLLPELAFNVVAIGGLIGGCIVLAGAALAVPAFIVHLRRGGSLALKPHLLRAVTVSAITAAVTVPLLVWAHRLSQAQRNGASNGYSMAFVGWMLLCVLTVGCWTAVAGAIGLHLAFHRETLRLEAALATTLTTVMCIVSVASVTWWAAIATSAPWFLHGTPTGTAGSAFDLPLLIAVIVMIAATGLAITATAQIHSRQLPRRAN